MKRHIFLILFLIITAGFIYGNNPPPWKFNYDGAVYNIGDTVPVFAETADILENPSADASVLNTLPAGEILVILNNTETAFTNKGFADYWYLVKQTGQDGSILKGFIWGGYLSKAAGNMDINLDGKDEYLLMGITGYVNRIFNAEFRYVDNGKILSSVQFDAIQSEHFDSPYFFYYVNVAVYPYNNGFHPPLSLFDISFLWRHQDYMNGDVILYWDGSALRYSDTISYKYNAGSFTKLKMDFPGDNILRINILNYNQTGNVPFIHTDRSDLLEVIVRNNYSLVTNSMETIYYQWNGNVLKKVR